MTLEDFRENYSGFPGFDWEFAEAAIKLEDDDELKEAAKAFLEARNQFDALLIVREIEYG